MLVFLLFASIPDSFSATYNEYTVPCDHSMSSCICPPFLESGAKVDVCVFSLTIANYQTFTAYRIDPVTNQIAFPHGGKAWYINSTTGDLQPFPGARDNCESPSALCTHPFTVDGYSYRTYMSVNGRLPGPTLIVSHNQTVYVNVTNTLDSETVSIHWHGVHQHHTHWMDGVPHVSQCGINSGTSFTYIFQGDPPGTHWYHSHIGSQRNDGITGALIILDESQDDIQMELGVDYVDKPDQHTLLLQDWQNSDASDILLLSTSNTHFYYTDEAPDPTHYTPLTDTVTVDGTVVGEIPYWSGLINGRGRYHNVSYTATRLSIFTISPNDTYRFRLVGGQHVYAFMVSIDEHQLQVISKDGVYIDLVTVDFLVIQPGERYDVLVEGKPREDLHKKSDYVIRAQTLEVCNDTTVNGGLSDKHVVEAILHYDIGPMPKSTEYEGIVSESVPVFETCSTSKPCVVLNCPFKQFPSSYNLSCMNVHQLKLLYETASDQLHRSSVPDETVFFNFGAEGVGGSGSVNARNNRFPSLPLSLVNTSQFDTLTRNEFCRYMTDSSVCDGTDEQYDYQNCICANVHKLPLNKSIMLVLSAITADKSTDTPSSHSVHLHGHRFHVLDIQYGKYSSTGQLIASNDDISCGGSYRCTNPNWRTGYHGNGLSNLTIMVDTITVPAGGYVVGYFHSNNPGYWYLHCQSEVHHVPGMGVVLMEGDIANMAPPPKGMSVCGNFLWTVDDYFTLVSGNGTASSNTDSNCFVLPYSIIGSLSSIALLLTCSVMITICCIVCKEWRKNSKARYKHLQHVIDSD